MNIAILHPKKIEFWLLLFFLLRIPSITHPPLEKSHNWRQSTGLMVARNYDQPNSSFAYPTINETGERQGVIGMEFPILYYTHHLVAQVFGYQHWYGRLINLIITTLGLFFFYRLLQLYLSDKQAFYATLILLCSIWLSFSRKTMPDTPSIALMLMGVYYGIRYCKDQKPLHLLLYFLLATLGALVKIPAVIYFSVLAIPFFQNWKKNYLLGIATLISIAIVGYWYFVWNVHIAETFGNWYNQGMTIKEGFLELANNLNATLKKFYWSGFYSYVFFVLFLAGIYFLKNHKKLLYAIVPLTLIFLAYMVKSGFFFHHHNYYIIPYVPVMATIAGIALSYIPSQKWQYLLLIAGMIEAIANQQHDFFIPKNQVYKMQLKEISEQFIPANSLVAVNGSNNPQMLYLLNRKGWSIDNKHIADAEYINTMAKKGCQYLMVDKHSFNTYNSLYYNKLMENEDYILFELNP